MHDWNMTNKKCSTGWPEYNENFNKSISNLIFIKSTRHEKMGYHSPSAEIVPQAAFTANKHCEIHTGWNNMYMKQANETIENCQIQDFESRL